MLHAQEGRLLGQVGLVEPAMFLAADIAVVHGQRARRFIDGVGQRVVAVQRVVVVARGVADRPVLVEAVVDRGGAGEHARLRVVGIARIGRAVVARGRHVDRAALVGRDAEVGDAAVLQVVGLEQHGGFGRHAQLERRRDRLAVQELLRAITVGLLHGAGDAERGSAVGKHAADVSLGAAVGPHAVAQREIGDVDARLLGDAVDQAAGRAAPVQHRRRALDHFDAVHVGQVAEVQRVIADAIDELVGDRGEATDRDLVALAVAMRERHAGHVLQRVLHRRGVLVAHHLGGDHVDGLRDVAQRCFGLGRADRVGRVIASAQFPADVGLDGDLGQLRRRGRRRLRPRCHRLKNEGACHRSADRVKFYSHFPVIDCNFY
ncbi:hypothetical protein D9M68_492070 [compost metagenome]